MRWRLGMIVENRSVTVVSTVPFDDEELVLPEFPADKSEQRRANDDDRKRNFEKVDADERHRRDGPHHFILQRLAPNSDYGRGHDSQHGRLQSVENRRDPRYRSELHVN